MALHTHTHLPNMAHDMAWWWRQKGYISGALCSYHFHLRAGRVHFRGHEQGDHAHHLRRRVAHARNNADNKKREKRINRQGRGSGCVKIGGQRKRKNQGNT